MADDNLRGINVTGVGEVRIEPDLLRVDFDVTKQSSTVSSARKATDAVTDSVLKLVRKLGVEDRDIVAASIRVNPMYRRNSSNSSGPPSIEGFQANRSINVTLRDMDQLDALLKGAVEAGVNGIGNINLDTSKRVELERQALDRAIADAMEQAQHVAGQFGVSAGTLLDVRVGSHTPSPMRAESRMMAMDASGGVPFAGGELSVTSHVTAVFAIGPN